MVPFLLLQTKQWSVQAKMRCEEDLATIIQGMEGAII